VKWGEGSISMFSADGRKINAHLSFPLSNLFHVIGTFPILSSKCTIRRQYD
jgi:hypothetical protein